MRELHGLKVRALACDLPDLNFKVVDGNKLYGALTSDGTGSVCLHSLIATLPPGNWTILGRADELFKGPVDILGILDFLPGHGFRDYQDNTPDAWHLTKQIHSWDSYRAANNITNQLILIQQ